MKVQMQSVSDADSSLQRMEARYGAMAWDEVVYRRLAERLAETKEQSQRFVEAFEGGFCPSGLVLTGAGNSANSMNSSAIVQPVGAGVCGRDSKGAPGVYTALHEAADTLRHGRGVGCDFSAIRPLGASAHGDNVFTAGVFAAMRLFDQACMTFLPTSGLRTKVLALLRIDHPDVEWLLEVGMQQFSHLQLSIAVTDDFMRSLEEDGAFDLVHEMAPAWISSAETSVDRQEPYVYRTLNAADLWGRILRAASQGTGLGLIFIDSTNRQNNLRYAESISAAIACANLGAGPYGSCESGTVNLLACVDEGHTNAASFNFQRLEHLVRVGVEILNRSLDGAQWPLASQKSEALAKRRIAINPIGLNDALAALGMALDDEATIAFLAEIGRTMRDAAYGASIELAKASSPFPFFDADEFLAKGTFASTLPEHLQALIRAHGIRNGQLLSFSGVENFFELPGEGSSATCTRSRVSVVEVFAPFIDSSVGHSVQITSGCDVADLDRVYQHAWQIGVGSVDTLRLPSLAI